jgi:hypothetical protein
MHRIRFILLGLLLPLLTTGQVAFKTIVSQQPITVGESFQVQYVLENVQKDDGFTIPSFKEFRVVSGPNAYTSLINKNIVFTLVAMKPGKYVIPGATANVKGKFFKSNDVVVVVISKKQASERSARDTYEEPASEYFLQPGEDPNAKMSRNLFLKVMVDRTSCFVGQPVVATFKLYSRLESKSDIVKNPGFYGFAVYDIINLNDNSSSTEIINGRAFDVHIIRSVQLYPLQPGIFSIDPMEVVNKVEFSKSSVNRKTEQKIVEGVFESPDPPGRANTVTYENNLRTEKIDIKVKPLPAARRPVLFNGATGKFSIHASIEKNELARNEKGMLIVSITGKGNFTQLPAPFIQWPAEIESFDAVVNDSLDKTQTPLKGSRTFTFAFVANRAGNYHIPPVYFSFFDPDSNRYKTLLAEVPEVIVSNAEIKEQPTAQPANKVKDKKDQRSLWIYLGIAFVVLLIIALEFTRPQQEEIVKQPVRNKTEPTISIEQLLQPVRFSLVADDGRFYTLLQKTIWDHLNQQLKLSGSKMNKDDLFKAMRQRNIDEALCSGILYILQECETAVFTKAELAHDKEELLLKTKTVLEQIRT